MFEVFEVRYFGVRSKTNFSTYLKKLVLTYFRVTNAPSSQLTGYYTRLAFGDFNFNLFLPHHNEIKK